MPDSVATIFARPLVAEPKEELLVLFDAKELVEIDVAATLGETVVPVEAEVPGEAMPLLGRPFLVATVAEAWLRPWEDPRVANAWEASIASSWQRRKEGAFAWGCRRTTTRTPRGASFWEPETREDDQPQHWHWKPPRVWWPYFPIPIVPQLPLLRHYHPRH